MFNRPSPGMAGLLLGITMMIAPAAADALKDEIAPTGKLRVAIAISPAGGAFWSTKTETGYAGVPVDLGKAMGGAWLELADAGATLRVQKGDTLMRVGDAVRVFVSGRDQARDRWVLLPDAS